MAECVGRRPIEALDLDCDLGGGGGGSSTALYLDCDWGCSLQSYTWTVTRGCCLQRYTWTVTGSVACRVIPRL